MTVLIRNLFGSANAVFDSRNDRDKINIETDNFGIFLSKVDHEKVKQQDKGILDHLRSNYISIVSPDNIPCVVKTNFICCQRQMLVYFSSLTSRQHKSNEVRDC